MKQQTEIEKYYNKFNEDKRLKSRHGQVEFRTTMHYIHKYLEILKTSYGTSSGSFTYQDGSVKEKSEGALTRAEENFKKDNGSIRILDVGAGTGAYSIPLAEEGYSVTAVELVKYNLGILKKKSSLVEAYQGNALNLKRFSDDSFDMTFIFGPMYHLFTEEDQLKALCEAKRVTRPGGIILAAYVMNEYSVITYAFKEGHIRECLEEKRFTEDYQTISEEKHLYHYMRTENIAALNEKAGLERLQIISADGPSDYIRPVLNAMDEKTFEEFIRYHFATCERQDTIGASSHTVDILTKSR